MKDFQALLFVLIAAVFWGTTGTAQAFAPSDAHPISFGAMRLIFGGFSLLIFALFQNKSFNLTCTPKFSILLAAFSMALYQPLFFSAVKLTGIAVGTVIAIGSAPIITGLIEWASKNKKPQMNWWIATALAILGSILLLVNKNFVTINPIGMLLALGAGLSFAVYTLLSKKMIENSSPNTVTAVIFCLSACLSIPVLFLFDLSWLTQLNGIATSLYLGIFATAAAYLLFSKGLKIISASTGVTLALAEPLTAALLGAFLIGEALPARGWIGVILILMAICLLSISPGPQQNKQQTKIIPNK